MGTIFTDKVYEMLSKKLPDEVFKLYVSWGIYKKDEEEQFKQDLVADGKDGGKKAKEIFAERFEAREKELKEKGTPDDGFKKLISNKNFRGLSKIWKKVNNIMNLLMNPAASGNVGRSLRTLTRLMANANGFKNYNAYVKHLDTEKEIDELLKTGAQGGRSQMTEKEFNDRVEGLSPNEEQKLTIEEEGNGDQMFDAGITEDDYAHEYMKAEAEAQKKTENDGRTI